MYFCVLCIVCFVMFPVLFVCVYICTELPPGGYPFAVKYISYHTTSVAETILKIEVHLPDRVGYYFRFTRVHIRVHICTHIAQLCEQVQAIYAHFIEGTITKQIACTWKQFFIKAD